MRVALVTQHYPPHFEGGTEVAVRAQARALAARGHAVTVTAGTDRPHAGADVERGEVDGLPVAHVFRAADEPYGLDLARPRLLARLLEEVRRDAPDVVHLHHWATLSTGLVRALADLPVVVTLHDHFASCPRFFRTPPDPALACPPPDSVEPCVPCCRPDAGGLPDADLAAGLVARRADLAAELAAARALVAPSRAHADAFVAATGVDPAAVRIVPHGLCVELAPYGNASRPADRPLTVLHAGHRTEAKGTLDLVRAMAALPAGRARLVLAGAEVAPGFDARLAEAAGDLPLAVHGPYDPPALAALAAEADLAAFPSRALESYGLLVDEALALGLPVWVSDRGALPERVGDAGRVLPAADPAAWTAALREVLDDPAPLAAMRAAAPRALRTAAHAAADLELLYDDLLPSGRDGGPA